MAATWTQADIDALKATIASGALTVNYAGPPQREITYQSLGEMRRLLADMISQVNGSKSWRHATFSKGFGPSSGSR